MIAQGDIWWIDLLVTLDKSTLIERRGKLSRSQVELILSAIDVIFGGV